MPDAASIAAALVLSERMGRRVGGSTGTNFYGACMIAAQLVQRGASGSLVTLLCDTGERYLHTYYNSEWRDAQQLDTAPFVEQLNRFLDRGTWMPAGQVGDTAPMVCG